MKLYVTRGLPASGKTTWAKELQKSDGTIVRANRDDLRASLHDGKFSKANEKQVTAIQEQIIRSAFAVGKSVVVDDTNLNPRTFQRLGDLAQEYDAKLVVRDFTNVDLAECIRRDAARPNGVGAKVIRQMWTRYLKPDFTDRYDENLPWCVIVDIDGTLAHMNGRSPYEWDRVDEDDVDELVRSVVKDLSKRYDIVLMSGRDGAALTLTEEWLSANDVFYDALYMRAEGDMRKDSIVKRELFEQYVQGVWFPRLVIDDRKQVVDMWRNELGLTVWQVAEGDF